MPTAYSYALLLHLVGVLTLFSGIAVAAAAQRAALRQRRIEPFVTLLLLARTGVLVAAPGAVLLIGAGAWLVHLSGLSLRVGWLGAAVAVFAVAAVLGAVGGQASKRARKQASALAPTVTEVPSAVRALLEDRTALVLNTASSLGMVVVLALMVLKPG